MTPLRIWQSALAPAGPQAAHIAALSWFLFVTTTVVGLLVLGMLAWALVRGHRRRASSAEIDPADDARLTRAVAGALGATVIVLLTILVSSFWTGRLIAALSAPSAVSVSVYGHQFWWEVQYEDAVPARRVSTANELHIPVGEPVVLHLTSRDVIHSFWVPMLHGKRDLVPGITTSFWLQSDRPGVFQGQCAEFCGRQHAHMAFTVVAEPAAEFHRWLAARHSPAAEPATEAAVRGREAFLHGKCAGCHAITGTSAYGQVGPDLTHIASRPTLAAGTLPNTREALARWITNPQLDKPGSLMPPNPLSPSELGDLVSYLEALR
jgi:cytochrome c oxidase subunit 2